MACAPLRAETKRFQGFREKLPPAGKQSRQHLCTGQCAHAVEICKSSCVRSQVCVNCHVQKYACAAEPEKHLRHFQGQGRISSRRCRNQHRVASLLLLGEASSTDHRANTWTLGCRVQGMKAFIKIKYFLFPFIGSAQLYAFFFFKKKN